MKCEEFMSLLPMYPDAIPHIQTITELRMHAAECEDCSGKLAQHEAMLAALSVMDEGLEVPASLSEGWRSAVRAESKAQRGPRRFHVKGWALAAAAVLMVVTGTGFMRAGLLFPTSGLDRNIVYSGGVSPTAAPFSAMSAAGGMGSEGMMPKGRGGALLGDSLQTDSFADMAMPETAENIVVYSASVHFRTERYDEDIQQLEAVLEQSGGWSERWSSSGEALADNPDSGRYAAMTIRVPTDALDGFVDALTGIGITTSSEISSEDISYGYYDTQGRLTMYEAQRDRLMELLQSASSLSEIIELENKLSEVQYTIESLVGRINSWTSHADSAVVYVTVTEVDHTAISSGGTASLWDRAKDAFGSSLKTARTFLTDMLIFLVMISPYTLVIAAIAVAVALAISLKRKYQRQKRRRREE